MAGWYKLRGSVTAGGKPRKAHWVEDGRTLCNLTGELTSPGVAPQCQTCLRRRGSGK